MSRSRRSRRFCAAHLVCLGVVAALPAVLGSAQLPARAQQSAAPAGASTPVQERLRVLGASRDPGAVHMLPASTDTTQWGWFNNAQPPVLRVRSGDTVVFETMMHSHNQIVPGTTIEAIKKLRTDHPGRGRQA